MPHSQPTTLIEKQISLLQAISALVSAASVVENEEIVIHVKSNSNSQMAPIAHASLQSEIITDALCNEIRSSILDLMDNKIMQLGALGLKFNEEALAEIQSTSHAATTVSNLEPTEPSTP